LILQNGIVETRNRHYFFFLLQIEIEQAQFTNNGSTKLKEDIEACLLAYSSKIDDHGHLQDKFLLSTKMKQHYSMAMLNQFN